MNDKQKLKCELISALRPDPDKPKMIIINAGGENIIHYRGNKVPERVSTSIAESLSETYPDVKTIRFTDDEPAHRGGSFIDFSSD